MGRALGFALLAFALFFRTAPVQAGPAIPRHTSLVVDQAGILSRSEQQRIHQALQDFQKRHGPQIQVLIVPSLEGEPIESYSIRVVDQWRLGGEKKDDGLLFLVALEDRAVRIEVGQGLEGDLPDALAGRIIDHVVVPRFRQGELQQGIVAGLQAIAQELGGELGGGFSREAQTYSRRHAPGGSGFRNLFPLFLFLFLFFRGFGRRRRGGLLSGMLLGSMMSGRHRSHWGGGGGGFGGFGGGGGGGFSGGGASGRW